MASRTPIELVPYSPLWISAFEAERVILQSALPAHAFRIEHIGSTAVPRLRAKPVIDVLVGAPSLAEIEAKVPELEVLGYQYVKEFEAVLPQRRYFFKPLTWPRLFHLHAVENDDPFYAEHILFRNALRSDPGIAADYLALKLELAARFVDDWQGYADAKGPFIRSVVGRLAVRNDHGAAGN